MKKCKQLELFKVDKQIDLVRARMLIDDAYLLACLKVVYNNQTPKEQVEVKVLRLNNRGFMRCDVALLTNVIKCPALITASIRKRCLKYARQVIKCGGVE